MGGQFGGARKGKKKSKGKKYPNAKPGDTLTLKSGAKVKVQKNGRFKFVKGGDKKKLRAHLNKIRGKYPAISSRSAKRAFNKHYASPKYKKSNRRTYDLNHTRRVVKDARYRRSPHIYDFKGVDTGKKVDPRIGKFAGRRPSRKASKKASKKSSKKASKKHRAQQKRDCL